MAWSEERSECLGVSEGWEEEEYGLSYPEAVGEGKPGCSLLNIGASGVSTLDDKLD